MGELITVGVGVMDIGLEELANSTLNGVFLLLDWVEVGGWEISSFFGEIEGVGVETDIEEEGTSSLAEEAEADMEGKGVEGISGVEDRRIEGPDIEEDGIEADLAESEIAVFFVFLREILL